MSDRSSDERIDPQIAERLKEIESALDTQMIINAHLFLMITSAETQTNERFMMGVEYSDTLGKQEIERLKKQVSERLIASNKRYRESFEEVRKMIWGQKE